jgi:hypothetical protein
MTPKKHPYFPIPIIVHILKILTNPTKTSTDKHFIHVDFLRHNSSYLYEYSICVILRQHKKEHI